MAEQVDFFVSRDDSDWEIGGRQAAGNGKRADAERGEVDADQSAEEMVLVGEIGGGAAVVGRADHHGAAKVGRTVFPGEKQPGDQAAHGVSDKVEARKLFGAERAQPGGEKILGDGGDGQAAGRIADVFNVETRAAQIRLQPPHDEGVHAHAVEQHDAFFPAGKVGGGRKHGRGVAEKFLFGNKKCRNETEGKANHWWFDRPVSPGMPAL